MGKILTIIFLFTVTILAEIDTTVLQNGLNGYDGERDSWIEWKIDDKSPFGGENLDTTTNYNSSHYTYVIVSNKQNYY